MCRTSETQSSSSVWKYEWDGYVKRQWLSLHIVYNVALFAASFTVLWALIDCPVYIFRFPFSNTKHSEQNDKWVTINLDNDETIHSKLLVCDIIFNATQTMAHRNENVIKYEYIFLMYTF